ncbi:MAG: hypothetical protein HC894_25960 [Microcoleus sp. SM1_3_4]|nr:hypothetical protein [Microcoleus sp. SM1_3_4]
MNSYQMPHDPARAKKLDIDIWIVCSRSVSSQGRKNRQWKSKSGLRKKRLRATAQARSPD